MKISVDLFYILIGLFIGIMVVYATSPVPGIVMKYPTLDTINTTTYVDNVGQCYKYYAEEVKCN